jgi:cob(I)alamin adenosyltransferase
VVNGTIDECSSHIGVLLGYVQQDQSELFPLVRDLQHIQKQLFCIGLEISGDGEQHKEHFIREEAIASLERRIDWFWERCAPLKNFILPGGSFAASYAHVCRAYVRRMERKLVSWQRMYDRDIPVVLAYVNRLSDYFFAVARWSNAMLDAKEVTWP